MTRRFDRIFAFRPVDTLFFRSGRPFNQSDPGAAEAESLFPPNPPTLVGAVRNALAQALEGPRGGRWSETTAGLLNGGHLRFGAPFLVLNGERLYPAPAALLRLEDENLARARPGAVIETDLGPTCLPELPEKSKMLTDAWLTAGGMIRFLAGQVPAEGDLRLTACLWKSEPRIGIGRDVATRRVEEGALYAPVHIRPAEGLEICVRVQATDPRVAERLAGLDGLPGTVALGGEHRAAGLRDLAPDGITEATEPPGAGAVVVATGPVIAKPAMLTPGRALGRSGGRIRMVCARKPGMIGGWDDQGRRPHPMRPVLPAGTTWFLDGATGTPGPLGPRHRWGFGDCLSGILHDDKAS
ncbi:type III-B CRISPR module-associated Cmr3 family protein (plasmid) [Tistrella mobilis]|uniref:Type III-B CRISPR module-associated protein Cmr3 n=1 Tax=Tistrella mobilis TaxID=171437 RepID=A0A162KXZ7_9PROT|nr:type III-B CRISPR module-associated Cmr3 family protein [Tistrella mobilis]KYO52419.1 hypothetical protein AUP44_05400 [Tistrella mobilis]